MRYLTLFPLESIKMDDLNIEGRVAISLAVGRYLRAAEAFSKASSEFTSACKNTRKTIGANSKMVVQVDFKHYLVTSDRDGNFEIEEIEKI